MVSGVTFLNKLEVVDQSPHTDTADQSEQIALFGRRGFIKAGTKQSVIDRRERERCCNNVIYVKNKGFFFKNEFLNIKA